jgi:antitoxin component YwqK of YwqJK toxin-antitoxin module
MDGVNQWDEKGVRHGVWANYNANGLLCWRAEFNHGKYHGRCEIYDEQGIVVYRVVYENGKIVTPS